MCLLCQSRCDEHVQLSSWDASPESHTISLWLVVAMLRSHKVH